MGIRYKNLKKVFFKKKVLITGHTGFKGSWMLLMLSFLGAKVVGVSNKEVGLISHFSLIKKKIKFKNYLIDIRNYERLKNIINKEKPDFIFHLAAQSLVKKSYINPSVTWTTNLNGTLNLLNILKEYKSKCTTVFITSDKVYKNLETKIPYNEKSELGGLDPYSCSKSAADLAIQSYLKSYFTKKKNIRIGVARAGNVVGGGDWSKDRLIPDCVSSWSKSKKVNIRQLNSTRPWQHVLEILYGYLIFAFFLNLNGKLNHEIFNFGPNNNENHTVKEVITLMKKNWRKANWISKIDKKSKKHKESVLLNLNSNKANFKLKWKPILKFNQVIELTASWYKNYYENKQKAYDLSFKQINEYFNLLK